MPSTAVAALTLAGPQRVQAAAEPLVRDQYDLKPLTVAGPRGTDAAPGVATEMRRCLGPATPPQALQTFLAQALADADAPDPTRGAQLVSPHNRGVVLAAAGQWACVPLSKEGFPQWPVEALQGLIVPVGVPARLTLAWRQNLLAQVARDGVARGLVVYPGGQADQVHVIAEQWQALQVKFTLRLLPAGSYKEAHYPAVLRHPGLTQLLTRSAHDGAATPWRMAIPPHRLLQPVQGDYVVLRPRARTRVFNFEGTRWWLDGSSRPVVLQAGGRVVDADDPPTAGLHRGMAVGAADRAADRALEPLVEAASAVTPVESSADPGASTPIPAATSLGRWRVAHGVLHLALDDGTRYALALGDDPHRLAGMARRADPHGPEEEGTEQQWPVHMVRQPGGETGARPKQEARRAGSGLQVQAKGGDPLHTQAYWLMGTQLHDKLRSPHTLSTRPTGGQYLCCRRPATG
jgi:hypothetical protein